MVDVQHLRRRQRPDLFAQRVVMGQQFGEGDIVAAGNQQDRRRSKRSVVRVRQLPQLQLRGAPMLGVQRMVEHGDVRVAQRKAKFRANLEVARQQARVRRHGRELPAHGFGQHIPACKIGGVEILGGAMRAPSGHCGKHVVAKHCGQSQRGSRPAS